MVSNEEDIPSTTSSDPPTHDDHSRPVSDRGLVIFMALLALALLLGYFFLNKLVQISQEEDCGLAHRRNCGAFELPNR